MAGSVVTTELVMDQNIVVGRGILWKSWHLQVGRALYGFQLFNPSTLFSPPTLHLSLIMSDYGGDDDAGIK